MNVPSPSFASQQLSPSVNQNIMTTGVTNVGLTAPMNQNNPSPQISSMVPMPISNPPANPTPVPSHTTHSQHDLLRLRSLVSSLRDSLRNFFNISSLNIDYHIQLVNFNKNLDHPPKLEKSLEDILALCNQIELCLRTILECAIQYRDSQNYLPFQVTTDYNQNPEVPPQTLNDPSNPKSYTQYLYVLKKQIAYAKSIYEILSESTKQIKQLPATQPMVVQPSQGTNPVPHSSMQNSPSEMTPIHHQQQLQPPQRSQQQSIHHPHHHPHHHHQTSIVHQQPQAQQYTPVQPTNQLSQTTQQQMQL
ncbi:mitogen-activated protein kinase 14B-like [Sarcoptes scabiei]|nr:mitogen-activated protein kinase 14B-like [Sarcoptes scabiei]